MVWMEGNLTIAQKKHMRYELTSEACEVFRKIMKMECKICDNGINLAQDYPKCLRFSTVK